jgi:hypothetical protein
MTKRVAKKNYGNSVEPNQKYKQKNNRGKITITLAKVFHADTPFFTLNGVENIFVC